MKSPFPGMDPYLEIHWGDVHHTFITFAQGIINEQLPSDLRARVDERILVDLPSEEQDYYPDIRIVERGRGGEGGIATLVGGIAVAEPLEVPFLETETQGFIEIIEAGSARKVITVIELVSPSNKRAGKAREVYRKKQRDLADGGVSMVEIDLLRAGPHVLQVPLRQFPPEYRTAYKACMHRGWKPAAEIFRVPLRERLPIIRVPLREKETGVPLDLQAVIEHVYRHGRYDDIDYTVPPVPPLEPEDAAWADVLLRAAGKRV